MEGTIAALQTLARQARPAVWALHSHLEWLTKCTFYMRHYTRSIESLQAVGIFDSGVGGLSVLREIRTLLPKENLVYVADSAHLPYGNKSTEYIRSRAVHICRFLLSQGVKAIVVACNSATAAAINELRTSFNVPIVGMEPALKPAAELTQSGVVAILATASTLKSEKFERLHNRFSKDTFIIRQPCDGWVDYVESCDRHGSTATMLVARSVQPMLDKNADALVLGCTHYPFLIPVIRAVTGPDVHIIETGTAVARQLQRLLQVNGLRNEAVQSGRALFYTSGRHSRVLPVMSRLWGEDLELSILPGGSH